jgi:hypothetical protein
MAEYGVAAAAKNGAVAATKDNRKDVVTADKNKCCYCQRWLLKALLVMVLLWQQKNVAPFEDGAIVASKDGWQWCCCSC